MSSAFFPPQFEAIYAAHPLILIDTGASGGIAGRWRRAGRHLKVVGFEPDARAYGKLAPDGAATFVQSALAENDGEVRLFLTKKQECSSIFMPNEEFVRQFPDAERMGVVSSIQVTARRLSEKLLATCGADDPDFLKVDAQGAELAVLRGASDGVLGRIFGIEAEVEFAPIYCGQPLFADVDTFLRGKGFHLFDLKRYYWKRKEGGALRAAKGQIVFADALYLKTYEALREGIDGADAAMKKAKLMKALAVCRIYGMLDYALYLSRRAREDGMLSAAEMEAVSASIGPRRPGFRLKGAGRVAARLYKAYKYLTMGEYYCADPELGNEE